MCHEQQHAQDGGGNQVGAPCASHRRGKHANKRREQVMQDECADDNDYGDKRHRRQ